MLKKSSFLLCLFASVCVTSYSVADYYSSFTRGLTDGAKFTSFLSIVKAVSGLKKQNKNKIVSLGEINGIEVTTNVENLREQQGLGEEYILPFGGTIAKSIPDDFEKQIMLVLLKKVLFFSLSGHNITNSISSLMRGKGLTKVFDAMLYSSGYISSLVSSVYLQSKYHHLKKMILADLMAKICC